MEKQKAFEMTIEIEPFHWERHDLTVVRDGYNEDGVRILFVKEPHWYAEMLDNAFIFSI